QSSPRSPVPLPPSAPDIALPHGFGSRRTWDFTISLLSGAIERDRLAELVAGTAIVGYRDGEVTLGGPDAAQTERIAGEYRELITRKLSEAMRRPVRLAVLTADRDGEMDGNVLGPDRSDRDGRAGRRAVGSVVPVAAFDREDAEPAIPLFTVAECGLPSGQVWAAVL